MCGFTHSPLLNPTCWNRRKPKPASQYEPQFSAKSIRTQTGSDLKEAFCVIAFSQRQCRPVCKLWLWEEPFQQQREVTFRHRSWMQRVCLARRWALTSVQEGVNVLVLPQSRVVEIVSQGADGILQGQRNKTCVENNHLSATGKPDCWFWIITHGAYPRWTKQQSVLLQVLGFYFCKSAGEKKKSARTKNVRCGFVGQFSIRRGS